MKRGTLAERILFNISRFVSFYLMIAVVITINMFLFLKDMEFTAEMITDNAKLTFANTFIMALVGCAIDEIRRKLTVEKPLKRITDALEAIKNGDFSVRLDVNEHGIDSAGFREISEGINSLAKELSGVETLRTDFIANVSHELKTPLAVIQNYAAILRDPTLPAQQRTEYAASIAQTTRRLADLVSNILKLNKLENQQIFPEKCRFDLGEQLCQCLLAFETVWEEKQLELECDIAQDVMVEADPELLSLVWNNLLSNAMKFTPEGGTIGVRLTGDEKHACVSVSDTGCGMSKETGAHIFEKFYQGDTAHATQGNGLGLALVKRVVDITGGVITVSSTPGKGSTFTVLLGRSENGTA